jgi:hypothetical protein
MVNSKVPKIELSEDGSINLTVDVRGFAAAAPVEISGHATQTNGAVATFYDVQNLPPDHRPDDGSLLTVIAFPSVEFQKGGAITVVTRAAEVWVTNLNPGESPPPTTGASQLIKPGWKEVDSGYHYAVTPGARPDGWGAGGAA